MVEASQKNETKMKHTAHAQDDSSVTVMGVTRRKRQPIGQRPLREHTWDFASFERLRPCTRSGSLETVQPKEQT
jgi:hypothetical protein